MVTITHQPVLLAQTIQYLAPRSGGRYVDGTVGGGGHAEAILEASPPDGRLLGLDLDAAAIDRASARLARFGDRVVLVESSFSELERVVRWERFAPADGILLDLGLSSDQLASDERGFAFSLEGPLDMRFDPSSRRPTAAQLIERLSFDELTDILRRYGEEPNAKRIARAIVAERARRPLRTTGELAALVERVVPRRGRTHPATRTFQALRIAVNDELGAVEVVLPAAMDLLEPGGRLAVITFHSLEDRIVKRFFVNLATPCICPPDLPICVCGRRATAKVLTKHGVRASPEEIATNPRSRSATLRVVEKLGEAD